MKNNRNTRLVLLSLFVMIFLGATYRYGPNVIFYFDQKEGVADITAVKSNYVYLEYWHKEKDKLVKLSFREGNSKKMRQLESGTKRPIIYSSTFPNRMSIVDYDEKPALGDLVLVIICALPLLLFKNIK